MEKKKIKYITLMKIIHIENLKKAQTSIKSIIKEKLKDVEVILTINKNQKIKTNKIKDNENIKNLEKLWEKMV